MTLANSLHVSSLATLPPNKRKAILDQLTDRQVAELYYDWSFQARPSQLPPPGEWRTWLSLAGRGWGKTRTKAHYVIDYARRHPGCRIALVAETAPDARDTMVLGHTGIVNLSPPWDRPTYKRTERKLTWANGATAQMFSAEKPGQLRGPQFHLSWLDEIAKFRHLGEVWDNVEMSTRLGDSSRIVAFTIPRPLRFLRDLISEDGVVLTRGSTGDNATNLPRQFLARLQRKYAGTRVGRQEMEAELLEDVDGQLVTLDMIRAAALSFRMENGLHRWQSIPMTRVVVGVDPAVTAKHSSNLTGVVVVGLGRDGDYYVLADLSDVMVPAEWAAVVQRAWVEYGADRVVAEVNNGGDMVGAVLRAADGARDIPYTSVHATRGKHVRFEPVGLLYEQGRVHHVGSFVALEDQVCGFTVGGYAREGSPDRADALVWAITQLMDGRRGYMVESPIDFGGDELAGTSHWRK